MGGHVSLSHTSGIAAAVLYEEREPQTETPMTDMSSSQASGTDEAMRPHTLEAIPADADDACGEYTFVPRDAEGDERLTRWLTAEEDAIVDLSEWR